jgi:hypothetical protein
MAGKIALGIALLVAAIVVGFAVTGSPTTRVLLVITVFVSTLLLWWVVGYGHRVTERLDA